MSKKKKKVIVTSQPKKESSYSSNKPTTEMTFNKETYKWVSIGVGLVIVGMLLMIGGFNENPNVWDESGIYGFRRTVLAPIVILSGLVVNIYAIFK